MDLAPLILTAILGLVIAGANLAFWWWVVRHGEQKFRARVERRYRVTIRSGTRGHWLVTGPGSKGAHFLIELLQLAYFLGAMLVWSVAMLLAVFALTQLQRI